MSRSLTPRSFSRGSSGPEAASIVPRIESSSGAWPSQSDALAHSGKKGKNVALDAVPQPFCRVPPVRIAPNSAKAWLCVILPLILLVAIAAQAQDKDAGAKGKSDSGAKDSRLTIVVTGGEDKKPIDSASVYIRYVEERKLGKDKKIEMNLKTNQSGVCHVPIIPPGKFVIQVIAEGWKTYGEYYDVSDTEQTIKISLVRPPKWY
jgi:hypothetical protein